MRKHINKYRVADHVKNGLTFDDLPIKLSDGQSRPLKVAPGDFIPEDLIDARDLRLSEMSGYVYRTLRAGSLVDITKPVEEKIENKPTTKETKKSNYTLVESINPEEFARMRDKNGTVEVMKTNVPHSAVDVQTIKFDGFMPEKAAVTNKEGTVSIVEAEKRPDSEKVTIEKANSVPASAPSGNGINSYTEFQRLTHYAKLDFINITNNKSLLREVATNSEVKQLSNIATGRLREMGEAI